MTFIKRASFALPFILFALIVILLWHGLRLHPNEVPSPLINKPAPSFQLPDLLLNHTISSNDFKGHVTLFNVWATWCYACAVEHEFLLNLAQEKHLLIYGLDYKDDPIAAKKWLKTHGNPYKLVATDETGETAIDWGVYGTPETFLIDKKGIIRYKHIGLITPEVWEKILEPRVHQLQGEF
jgi:cytochrome c biogenesis protein CcmG, thiol:disulfide interchange protein DsbE